jgi:general stress protein CsbA
MQTYLKTRPVWIQLLLFIGMAFGILLVLGMIGGAILSKLTGISLLEMRDASSWDINNPNMIVFIRGMLLLQFLGLFVIPSLLFAYFSDPKPLDYIGLKPPSKAFYWILGILALVVAIPFVDFMGYLNQRMFTGETEKWLKNMEQDAARQIQFMLNRHTLKELIMNLIFIALFAGVGEELFFRGVLQRLFIKLTRSPWLGIILTAALFSAIHFQFLGFIPRFLLGILLGCIYWYSGSLWPAIIAHFFYDGFMVVLIYINPEMIENVDATIIQKSSLQLVLSSILSLIVTLVVVWQMKKRSETTYADVYNGDNEETDQFSF